MKAPFFLEPGTVIHATLRRQDLIPAFIDALKGLELTQHEQDVVNGVEEAATAEDYYDSDDCDWDMDALWDMLNCHSPLGYYFGAHEGDGSDFGVWPADDEGVPV